jgi:nitrite reductase (NADH) small subunit
MEQRWIAIGGAEFIPLKGSRTVSLPQGDIAIFHCGDGSLFALENRCPHKGGPLSEGIVHGRRVTCPLHSWVIELENGAAVAPDVGCARPLPVALRDGQVWLDVSGLKATVDG